MCPFFPMLNKNPGPVSKLKNSTQVGEQRQRSTNDPDPRQYLVPEALSQQRHSRRLHRWLCQLCNDCRTNFVVLANILGVQNIKRRRKVFIRQMLKLDWDQLTISLGSTSLRTNPIRFDRCVGPYNDDRTGTP